MDPHMEHNGLLGQVDALQVPRYAGFTTFARLPRIDQVTDHDIAVVGVPFDAGVTYRPGARFGPSSIRQASRLLRPFNPAQEVSPFSAAQIVDAGDISCSPFNIEVAIGQIESGIAELIGRGTGQGKGIVCLGGDHTIALPVLRALHAVHGPIALVHFDAHLDTWNTYYDAPFTHGTPFRRAWEEGLLAEGHCGHVGIRGPLYDQQDLADDERMGFTIVHTREFIRTPIDDIIERVRARVGDRPVYLSVDIDVLDPAHAPATGTPEAGGMTSRELLEVLRGFGDANIVGGDVVEVSPAYDHAEMTAVVASHVAYEMVCLMARSRS